MKNFSIISLLLFIASVIIAAAFISATRKNNSTNHYMGRLIFSNTSPEAPLTCIADPLASDCHYTPTSLSGTTNGNPDTNENLPETTNNTTLPE